MGRALTLGDYRRRAQRRLPRIIFDYLEGGAGSERGLRRNRDAFERVLFEPKRLRDVSRRNQAVELFGRTASSPLVVAPIGLSGLFWPDGDVALARAAAAAGLPFVLSTAATTTIEDLAARVSGGDLWLQLYVVHHRLAEHLVLRARDAGYTTLVLTVDVAVNGRRERDLRNRLSVPLKLSPRMALDGLLHPAWTLRQLQHGFPTFANLASPDASDIEAQAALMRREMDAAFDWDGLKRLRDLWPHTLIVKGILSGADAARCFELGADGVVLSNHGARQIEDFRAPLDILPAVAPAASAPILLDSGVRDGTDVVKAVALGAKAVLLGRVVLYGLAAAGQDGASHVLSMLKEDIDRTLALIGCPSATDLDPSYLFNSEADTKAMDGNAEQDAASWSR